MRALQLDHIEGGGNKDRQAKGTGSTFYAWLKRNGYPPGYQVLCANCNYIKRFENREHGYAHTRRAKVAA